MGYQSAMIMKLLHRLNNAAARLEEWILIIVVMTMVLFAFLQVVLRNVLSEGIMGGDIILRHLVLWVGFIGASLATRTERHINIDVFTRFLKGWAKLASGIIVYLFSALTGYFLTSASISFVLMEREFKTVLFGSVQSWYFQVIIPVGFALITFRFLLLATDKLIQFFSDVEEEK